MVLLLCLSMYCGLFSIPCLVVGCRRGSYVELYDSISFYSILFVSLFLVLAWDVRKKQDRGQGSSAFCFCNFGISIPVLISIS